jgi:hypothetical protein
MLRLGRHFAIELEPGFCEPIAQAYAITLYPASNRPPSNSTAKSPPKRSFPWKPVRDRQKHGIKLGVYMQRFFYAKAVRTQQPRFWTRDVTA